MLVQPAITQLSVDPARWRSDEEYAVRWFGARYWSTK